MNSTKTILFCQAPADVPYVLNLYEKNEFKNTISIFIINVEGLYTFFFGLHLNIERLVFIPYKLKSIKNILWIIVERRRINKLWKIYFKHTNNCDVYFFSRFEDWLTAAFIHRFAKNHTIEIKYVNHYDNSSTLFPKVKEIILKIKIHLLMLKIITNVSFKAEIKEKFPEFPTEDYNLKELSIKNNLDIYVKYHFKIDFINIRKPNMLFFISPCEPTILDPINYNEKLIKIIQLFNSIGFNTVVKGHPRLGIPKSISEVIDQCIPSYVPGEFLDFKMFDLCLGLDTTALCHYAKNTKLPTYSIIKLFPYSNKVLFDVAINYLNQQSEGKIKYCTNIKELEKIASTITKFQDERG